MARIPNFVTGLLRRADEAFFGADDQLRASTDGRSVRADSACRGPTIIPPSTGWSAASSAKAMGTAKRPPASGVRGPGGSCWAIRC